MKRDVDARSRRTDAATERARFHGAVAGAARARGATFEQGLAELLLALDDDTGELLQQELHEARGAWALCLGVTARRVLFVGSPLAGAIRVFARLGAAVTVLDDDAERAELAAFAWEAHAPGRVRWVRGDARVLPFQDREFDVVVLDDGLPRERAQCTRLLAEAARVSSGEVALLGDNRLGYKRSAGRHASLRVPRAVEWLRDVCAPRAGERTLRGYRAALRLPGFARATAWALYPHRKDFAHVVAIDAPLPAITIGPQERRNKVKLAGRALGLFSVFTPSFALTAARTECGLPAPLAERLLDELARATGEPRGELEHLVATRGGSAILFTRAASTRGGWVVHVPLSPNKARHLARHAARLGELPRRFPALRTPELLFHGRLAGVELACERRLGGLTAPQIAGDAPRMSRLLADVVRDFAALVVRDAEPFTSEDYAREVSARIARVSADAHVPGTRAWLAALDEALRPRLVGRKLPRVLHHADLRAKHVQIAPDGAVLGYLDWSTAEDEALPFWDLFHLVVHERKQVNGGTAGATWRALRDGRDVPPHASEALAIYARDLALDDETVRALVELYPVYVTAMGAKNWDYSRPRWLHRHFEV